MAVRRELLRIFSAAASCAVCMLPAAAHEIAVPHSHLPPVNITASEATPAKRTARPKPSRTRGTRSTAAIGPNQPAAGASGVTTGASSDGAGELHTPADRDMGVMVAAVRLMP